MEKTIDPETVPLVVEVVSTNWRDDYLVDKDINTYAVPSDLNWVLSALFGIILS